MSKKKSGNTPGPWQQNHSHGMTFIETSEGNLPICRVSAGNQLANANLIAAVPDLLEALERFIAFADKQNLEYESALIRQCKAAIAKATGEINVSL